MKTVKQRFMKAALALVLALSAQSSFAILVFDPTNLVQNTVSAAYAVKQEIIAAAQLAKQVEQAYREIQNLRNLGAVGLAARMLDLDNELKTINAFRDSAKNLYANLQDQKNYVVGVQKMVNVSGLTPTQWIEREKTLVKQMDANATHLMKSGEATMAAVEQAQKVRDQVLADNDVDEGIRGTIQKSNVLIANVGAQMGTMLMHMKADSDVRASNQVMESAKAKKESEGREFINSRIKAQEAVPLFR